MLNFTYPLQVSQLPERDIAVLEVVDQRAFKSIGLNLTYEKEWADGEEISYEIPKQLVGISEE